jgi:ubiquinone/menaquinone biosynthesis C-methylase UbiE
MLFAGEGEVVMLTRLFLWCYAALYDVVSGPAERAGLREQRRDLLAQATGATVEIGAGTGLNLPHYPLAVTRLALVEPDPHMSRRLRRRAARLGRDAEILDASAARLPFPDASFDTAVVTFTLCSVPDEQAALDEITRILAPGGRLLFLEHVRSTDPRIAAQQDKIPFPYSLIGCRPNRDTLREIKASPLTVESVRSGELPKAPKIERPMIVGTARRPASALPRVAAVSATAGHSPAPPGAGHSGR